jgi:carbonic anhydrase/acetyltransferase-like protein (isoleucine patch superfamily)
MTAPRVPGVRNQAVFWMAHEDYEVKQETHIGDLAVLVGCLIAIMIILTVL